MQSRKLPLLALICCAVSNLSAVDMENVYINGFFSQGYLKSSDNNLYGADTSDGTWEFNEAAISIKALLSDEMTAGIQLMSRDFGPSGNNDLAVDWAFLDYRARDELGFRVGKFKKPEGLYNTIRDADAVRTSIILPQGIYAERLRDIQIAIQGLGVYGFLDAGSAGSIDYTLFLGTQPVNTDEPVMKNDFSAGFFGIENDGDLEFKYSYGAHVVWNTPVTGLRFAQSLNSSLMEVNGINSRYPWFSSDIRDAEFQIKLRTVTSFEYQTEKYTFNGEYMLWKSEAPNAPIGGPITGFGFPAGGKFEFERESYYLQFTYNLNEKIQLGTYYSWNYEKEQGRLDKDSADDKLNDWVISSKYVINDWWLLKAEIHFFDGWLGAAPDSEGNRSDDWTMFAIKSTVSF